MADVNLVEASANQLRSQLQGGKLTSRDLVEKCISRIDQHNDYFRAVLQLAPKDLLYDRARILDEERRHGKVRGPLHGIPILVKDNIATHPSLGLETTAGCFALRGSKPRCNAPVIESLLDAGVIIMGKANLSELANYKGPGLPCGWSAVGGQTQSAYVRGGVKASETFGGHSNPGGSSSGSAVGVAAGFSPIAIGTESCGSLVMPANRAALYTIKPSIGLVSQAGLVPGSDFCDAVGPLAKTAIDIAHTLDAIVDPSQLQHRPSGGYAAHATGSWDGIKIGMLDPALWPLSSKIAGDDKAFDQQRDADILHAFQQMKAMGIDIKFPVKLISHKEAAVDGADPLDGLMNGHFERIMNAYLEDLEQSPVRSLREMVDFNSKHADIELPKGYETQADLVECINYAWTAEDTKRCIARCHEIGRVQGIDYTLKNSDIDVILGPADSNLDNITAMAGYPYATLPYGYYRANGRPFGLVAIAGQYQEALLVKVMSAWEANMGHRREPLKL